MNDDPTNLRAETGALLADVALPVAVAQPFSYLVPAALEMVLKVGSRVLVPLSNRRVTGYVVGLHRTDRPEGFKPVIEVMDDVPLFPASMVEFFRWTSDYYLHPPGMVIRAALPAGLDVKGEAGYALKADGCTAEEEAGLTEDEKKVLSLLLGGEVVSLSFRCPDLPKAVCRAALSALEEKGIVVRTVRMDKTTVRPRTMKTVSLRFVSGNERAGLPPRQAEVVDLLEKEGSALLSELSRELPGAARAVNGLEKKGLVRTGFTRVHRTPIGEDIPLETDPPHLTPDQESAFDALRQALDSRIFQPFLLHGVTGSGKTEVYLRAIEHVLAQGRTALVLVPEITLSLNMEAAIRGRFGDRIGLIHSGLGRGEAYDQWEKIASGSFPLVLGARSAVFAPLDDIGLIIVDEEHDPSYKQEDRLRYNARDLSLVRGSQSGATVILGSATPSLRTYRNAVLGKIGYLSLPRRVYERPMPTVEVADMRQEKGKGYFSAALVAALRETLARGEQSLLFLNRRGYSPVIMCPRCGEAVRCPNCNVSLTYHKARELLMCHYCGHERKPLLTCPTCGGGKLIPLGLGTERLEKEMRELFPEARIERLDSDTTTDRGELFHLLRELRRGEVDILLGTQMITKGHDFPNVTLVGVIAADQSMHFPDFSASERTFQLLAQVSGRAGRGMKPGRVIVQTFNPDHYSIRHARDHAFHAFYLEEILNRVEFRYPPFSRLMSFPVTGTDAAEVEKAAAEAAKAAKEALASSGAWGRVLGPAPAAFSRLKGKYRWHVLLMAESPSVLNRIGRFVLKTVEQRRRRGVTVAVDVDPVSTL